MRVSDTAFSVYKRGGFVEVHRRDAFSGVSRALLTARALGAITSATGCPVRPGSLEGDGAIFAAELDCDESKPPAPLPLRFPSLDCQPTPGPFGTEYDCIFLP